MTTDTIGAWAGLVWNALNEGDVLDMKQIKKMTKLKEKEVCTALGWLAREKQNHFRRKRRRQEGNSGGTG